MRAASLLIFLALAGSATAAVIGADEQSAAQARVVSAAGSFSLANSRDGMPIFSAAEIAPGDSVSGTVEIANESEEPGELVVAQHDVEDTPGLEGGELSSRLTLRIADVTAPASPVAVYTGALAPMSARPAGVLGPGASRTYEFIATLPEAGPTGGGQNDVQGASVSVAYSWTAGEVRGPAAPANPAPGQPPSGSPPVPAATAPAASPLRLRITKVRRTLDHGHLIVLAHCDTLCSISARSRLRARSGAGQKAAKLGPTHRSRFSAGRQRLRIRVPSQLRRWLERSSAPIRLRARLSLLARNPSGERALARRTLRLRARAHQ